MKRIKSNTDDPAFPCDVNKTHKGLTKREFAIIQMLAGRNWNNCSDAIRIVDGAFVILNAKPTKEVTGDNNTI